MDSVKCLYKDENIYVVHKPPNVPFHSLDESDEKNTGLVQVEGIVGLTKKYLKDNNIYPVHRLDRMTSGLMVFARSKKVNSLLSQLFLEKKIEKYYLALATNKPKKKQGLISGDMQKGRSGSYLLKRSHDNPAVTRFFTKKITLDSANIWLYILKPETGKTHQLRVALKSLGSPIYGDTRYAGQPASRGYLHAYKIRFDLYGKRYEIMDRAFEGSEFSLHTMYSTTQNTPFFADADLNLTFPESFPWPKKSFLLS